MPPATAALGQQHEFEACDGVSGVTPVPEARGWGRSRKGYNWTGAFRQSRPAAAHLDAGSSIIDGEAAVSRADGLSRFL